MIGDKFVKDSATNYFKNVDQRTSYANRHFYVSILDSEEYNSNTKSILARLRNNLVTGMNKCIAIPKIIVVVLEDSIISDIHQNNYGLATQYDMRVKWLVSQYRKTVEAFLDYLPLKAKRENWPKFVFICPSIHTNYRNNGLRKKFTKSLEEICAYTERMTAMRLKLGWDPEDNNLYLEPQQRYTSEGYASFWNAVDKLIEEYNRNIFDSADSPVVFKPADHYDFKNEYKWQSPTYAQSNRRRGRGNWRPNRY